MDWINSNITKTVEVEIETVMKISWFSAGVSSAVATKMSSPDRIIYIDIDDQHPDTYRFIADCEKWFGKKIEVISSHLKTVENACLSCGFLAGYNGMVSCSSRLKRRVRRDWELKNPGQHTYVWGFDANEKHRALNMQESARENNHLFPIIDKTKKEVHGILEHAGIKRPAMYDMGYPNNNCIGCLRGGAGYWNKIKKDFPDVFARRSAMERKMNHHILATCFLDELPENKGRKLKIIVPDCGIFCEINEDRCVQYAE